MPNHIVTVGRRRFTCLAPGLVRMEFSPDGVFEDRRSTAAYAHKTPLPFKSVRTTRGTTVLDTGAVTIHSSQADKAFFPDNLELRWDHGGLRQFWCPGDMDYRNLGGTVTSLDVLNKDANLTGTHVADMDSPDTKAMLNLAGNTFHQDYPRYKESGKEEWAYRLPSRLHTYTNVDRDKLFVRSVNHTLDQRRYGPGILSRSGYFFLNDSLSPVMDADDFPVERDTPGTQDWYFFAYGDDYRGALKNWRLLAGPGPLPGKHIFGIILCRWPAFNDVESKALMSRFRKEGMPLSVLVIDMEWSGHDWCNWDWDSNHIPDAKAFFAWCHRNHMQVTLNVHPEHVRENDSHFAPYLEAAGTRDHVSTAATYAPGSRTVPIDMCSKREASAFMRVCHDDLMEKGLDFWWVDGTSGSINGGHSQLVTNKIFFEHSQKGKRRGMLLSRYGGLGSHRYGVFFTGDTFCHWQVLQTECEFNIRAGHLGIAYVSHDIGGLNHQRAPLMQPNLYVRWVQFGVFNPVFRFHSMPGAGSRLPWDYGDVNLEIVRKWLSFRNALVPYIYTAARHHYDTDVPIVRGLFFEHPRDPACERFDQFYFGDALIVAPVMEDTQHREVYLPTGIWYDVETGRRIDGGVAFYVYPLLGDVPLYAKAGAIVTRQGDTTNPGQKHVDHLVLDIYPGANGNAELYEDDGKTRDYQDAHFAVTTFELKDTRRTLTLKGSALKGQRQGTSRRITVNAVLDQRPKEVALAGKKLSARRVAYHAATRRCTIDLGRIKVEQSFKLTIRK